MAVHLTDLSLVLNAAQRLEKYISKDHAASCHHLRARFAELELLGDNSVFGEIAEALYTLYTNAGYIARSATVEVTHQPGKR